MARNGTKDASVAVKAVNLAVALPQLIVKRALKINKIPFKGSRIWFSSMFGEECLIYAVNEW